MGQFEPGGRRRRAVITGIGIVSALGADRESTWSGVAAGHCAIGPITGIDTRGYRTQTGAQAWDFDATRHFTRRELRLMSRVDALAVTSAREAWTDSDARRAQSPAPAERIAVILGAGAGGMCSAEAFRRADRTTGTARARLLLPFPSSSATDHVACELGALGPRTTIVTACSSSATAIGYGLDWIRDDIADIVIVGGAEALCEVTYGGFNSLRAVDADRCRPFDARRRGMSLGECGAILVLEELSMARQRGARIYAEVLGYATSCDAHHMTAPHPEGQGAALTMLRSLQDAGLTHTAVGYINGHGTGTPHNDKAETAAIKAVFGERAYEIPVSSTKSQVGHCLGAAGGIEAAVVALALQRGVTPSTVGYEQRDPDCDLDYVPDPGRALRCQVALSSSFAFGGNNTCLVLGKADRP
ncbi:MAG: beta-ketoacyl-[acyl-carrier-protein] synthase family protein [Candidatus Schekmanbacteria bacterium]|nr:beta-ketoacyl-[acyl-carrier-protein] synthase family protein [Candidatus Schekmanbacteria bacterium]